MNTPERLKAVLDALPFGVAVFKPVFENGAVRDFEWQFMNRLALQPGPTGSGDRLGQRLLRIAPELAGGPLFKALLAAVVAHESNQLEQFFGGDTSVGAAVTTEECWYNVHTEPFHQGVLVTFEDIARQKRAEATISRLVYQDELTGIHNRRYFTARTPELLSLARREAWICALLYFDLDGFKSVNDTHGHQAGDKLLQRVAERLGSVKREGDIFFRSGGDEFALFLPNAKAALATAERVAAEFARPFELDGVAHTVGASIGVAVMLSEEADVEELLERADRAMYAAKARKDRGTNGIALWEAHLQV